MNTVCFKSNRCSQPPIVVTSQTVDGIKGLADCFVYVININSVFYVDSCHNITIISSGPVYVDNYDPIGNVLNLRGQVCYDFANNKAYVFNNSGAYRTLTLEAN